MYFCAQNIFPQKGIESVIRRIPQTKSDSSCIISSSEKMPTQSTDAWLST